MALPITSNMDYGFLTMPITPMNPMFNYKNRTCDVTTYGQEFAKSNGTG